MKIATKPTWNSLSRSFKVADCELTKSYEAYFEGLGAEPRVANYYPNIVRLMSDPQLESRDRVRMYSSIDFTDSERILVLSLFWRSDMGSQLREPLLRGIDHELYWHMYPRDLSWRPPTNRISGAGAMFSMPLCNPSLGSWVYPWLFEHFATIRYDDDLREWRHAQRVSSEERYRYASPMPWLFEKCIRPRRDGGYFEPFEVAWRTYRGNYYAWLPDAPEWHRVSHEWGLIRANRSARWAVEGKWDDDPNPVEDYCARVGQHRRRRSADQVMAATRDVMSQNGFLVDIEPPAVGLPGDWLDQRWVDEAELGDTATRFLVRTNSDFVDCDTARIDLEVVVADSRKGSTFVVWLPRPDGLYGRMWNTAGFNAHLRMVLLDLDDALGGDTRCPLNVRKWTGVPVMDEYPVHKYRFSPSPADQAPYVLKP